MPKGKSKKFIDKKNSVTFQLVHRSQRDPLIADDDAPLRILRPLTDPQAGKHLKKDADKRKEELEKYGIHFDDDYDYMQHLRSSEKQSTEWERIENSNCSQKKEIDKTKFNLPAKIFESAEEEKIGLLNRAIPKGLQLDLDPDIVATFEDDYNHDNPEDSDCDFEEDFIALAGGVLKEGEIPEEDDEYDEDEDEDDDDDDDDSCGHMEISDEEGDELGSLHGGQFTFRDEETRSRFTEYSMSSSVMRRNNQLSLLDDRFEKMYAEYDDSEIGALEGEEIDGNCDPDMDLLLRHVEKFKNEQKQQETESKDIAKLIKERMKLDDNSNSEDDEATNNVKLVVNNSENEKWDCESVLTTYSNIYNHPKIIVEPRGEKLGKIKINSKTGIPKDVLDGPGGKLTAKNLAQFDRINNDRDERNGAAQSIAETMRSIVSELSVRPKDETPEERKERKKALKDYRRERRIERKANSEAFKEEKKRQEKIMLNNRINIQGNRLV